MFAVFPLSQSHRVISAYKRKGASLTILFLLLFPPPLISPAFSFNLFPLSLHSHLRELNTLTRASHNMSESIGNWVKRDPNIVPKTTTWSSEKRVYEWKSSYTKDSAPSDPALEEELFSSASRVNSGIHFKSYANMSVSVKDGPPSLIPIASVSRGKHTCWLLLLGKCGKLVIGCTVASFFY